jgi:hypothetical protein
MLLIALIGLVVVWVAVIAVVVALCVGAAQGDRQLRDGQAAGTSGSGLLRLIAG